MKCKKNDPGRLCLCVGVVCQGMAAKEAKVRSQFQQNWCCESDESTAIDLTSHLLDNVHSTCRQVMDVHGHHKQNLDLTSME